jgi:hypothetical protein
VAKIYIGLSVAQRPPFVNYTPPQSSSASILPAVQQTIMIMKFTGPLFLALALTSTVSAQLYTDASANLPENGAKGASMDVRAADIDRDGDLDIVLANEFQANTILLNDGQGVFTKAQAGSLPQEVHDSEDVAIADFNADGFIDLIFCSEDDIHQGITNVHGYYLGDGTGKFVEAPYQFPDSESNAVIAFHVNSDTFPDVVFGNKGVNKIYINNGDSTFEADDDALPAISRTTQDLAIADIDGDGDTDMFAGNENGNVLYMNDGTGNFTDVSSTHLPQGVNMETRKATFGDIDGDLDADLFLSNVMFIAGKNIQNRLYLNDGTGKFTDVTAAQLPVDSDHTIDAIFEDVDLDSDLDIVVANVFGARVKVYRNDGSGTFDDATDAIFGATYVRDALGVIAADLNGDGSRDLYVCDRFMPAQNKKDLLLLRAPITAVAETGAKDNGIRIYPNQIADEFFVESPSKGMSSIIIKNLEGRLIDTVKLDLHDEITMRGSLKHLSLPTGMYIMEVPKTGTTMMVMVKH